jgi:hypothetical protein
MAKAQDVKIGIRVSCSSEDHCFVKFDTTRIYCTRCGTFRTAPTNYTWTWPGTTTFPQWTITNTYKTTSDCTSL